MDATESSHNQDHPHQQPQEHESMSTHHLFTPPGLTPDEFHHLKPVIPDFHTYKVKPGQCSSLLAQRIHAPLQTVWSIIRRFDKPQTYKHFIKTCHVDNNINFTIKVGDTRHVNVISALPAATITERLDILDDVKHVIGFTVIGGDHHILRNYRSVTTLHEMEIDGTIWTVVLESYVLDVPPEGNSDQDTKLFADTLVRLNLQKLASVSETKFGVGNGFADGTPKYAEITPKADTVYSIPRGHLKSEDTVTCKRRLSPEMEDTGRKQACTSSRGSRAQQLTASMGGSNSESSINKERSRLDAPTNTDRNSTGQRRPDNGIGARILAIASNFR